MTTFKRLPPNEAGRDFVVGDIHGCYHLLGQLLRQAAFDPDRDRLFSVGDTVDRGPLSPQARDFLRLPYVHAVRGNHEDMFLDLYRAGNPSEDELRSMTRRNGMEWWMDIGHADRRAMLAEFERLPIAIEIPTRRGTVGLVHGEVPQGMSWQTFTRALERHDRHVIHRCLWGRERIHDRDESGVPGIGRVFVGHTPVRGPVRLGNVYYLDSGAVFGVMHDDPSVGRMTMSDVMCRTVMLTRPPASREFTDLRRDDKPLETPFGVYSGFAEP